MRKIWNWITASSADPIQVSLTVRGFLVLVVGFVVQLAPLACALSASICFDATALTPIVDIIVDIVRIGLELAGAGLMLWGLLRKIKLGRWAHPDAV